MKWIESDVRVLYGKMYLMCCLQDQPHVEYEMLCHYFIDKY